MNILVVDDSEDFVDAITEILSADGHSVRTALTGAGGVAVAQEELPELVLIDLWLPDMPGYEVAAEIRRLPGGDDCILAAITGAGNQALSDQASRVRFDFRFHKPFGVDVVHALLRAAETRDRQDD